VIDLGERRECASPMLAPLYAKPTVTLTKPEIVKLRARCMSCPLKGPCRDFAYTTRMPGFLAGTTDADRAEAFDRATQFVAAKRAEAKRRGVPFPASERDRVFTAALRAAHLSRQVAA
jgi:hypothetical protein